MMNNFFLQIAFIFGSIFFFALIIFFLKKNALSLKYSLIWMFSAVAMIIISIFPDIIWIPLDFLGFEVFSNAIFSLIIGFIIIIALSLTSIVSKQATKIKQLAQVIALMEKRIRKLEDKIK